MRGIFILDGSSEKYTPEEVLNERFYLKNIQKSEPKNQEFYSYRAALLVLSCKSYLLGSKIGKKKRRENLSDRVRRFVENNVS